MRNANSWFTAQEPRFVDAASNVSQRVAPHKHEEVRLLAAAVDAHRRAGGAYVVIDTAPSAHAPRRWLGV
ncbi:hypothetical protein M0D44_13880 [Xanthomonas prunicola]|uniref:hypothetical protein n=1 Tax=Xanthomonas prunicola TaxID=2053930 RepID=UPI0021B337F1|nr:hypothetical protein [Xanthomonas prunicola]UXA47450.1 hypothetical protein M0D44_13880 [Xanthomonas prunicola]